MKPTCTKCGTPHWKFVACADAPAANEREEQNAVKREQAVVMPIFRGKDGKLAGDKRTSFATEFATGGLRAPIARPQHDPPEAA